MCEPTTIAYVAAAVVGGTAVYQGYAQRKQASYQAKVSSRNAKISEAQAKDALDQGDKREMQLRRKVAAFKGQQRATLAASGVNVDTGSAARLQADTTQIGELDALAIRETAQREAWGYRVGALNASSQSELDKLSGKYNQTGTILGGIGQAASVGIGTYGALKA